MASFLSILWLISELLCRSLACYDRRDHVIPTTRKNRKLKGNHLIQRIFTASQISCSHFCLKNSRCISINYNLSGVKDGGLCELNDAGLSGDYDNNLVMAKGFIFSQIRCKKVDKWSCPKMNPKLKDFALEFPTRGITDAVFAKLIYRGMTEFTLCLWMNSKDNQGHGTLFSYAVQNSMEEILIFNYQNLQLRVGCVDAEWTQLSVADGNWHHICVTWWSTSGSWTFFIDGFLAKSGVNLNAGHVIKSGGVVVLGQEQDAIRGGFDPQQSFVGKIANVNLWDFVLKEEKIVEMSKSCLLEEGNVLKWEQFRDDIQGGVRIIEPSPCEAP